MKDSNKWNEGWLQVIIIVICNLVILYMFLEEIENLKIEMKDLKGKLSYIEQKVQG